MTSLSLSLSLPHGVIGAAPWPSAAWTLRGFSRLGQTLIDLRADLRMRLATRWNRSSCNVLSGSLKEKKSQKAAVSGTRRTRKSGLGTVLRLRTKTTMSTGLYVNLHLERGRAPL